MWKTRSSCRERRRSHTTFLSHLKQKPPNPAMPNCESTVMIPAELACHRVAYSTSDTSNS